MDAALVRERVAPDDGLVGLDGLAGERGEQLARRVDLLRVDPELVRQPVVYPRFCAAMWMTSPIPCPASMYQRPFGVIPALRQISRSF